MISHVISNVLKKFSSDPESVAVLIHVGKSWVCCEKV